MSRLDDIENTKSFGINLNSLIEDLARKAAGCRCLRDVSRQRRASRGAQGPSSGSTPGRRTEGAEAGGVGWRSKAELAEAFAAEKLRHRTLLGAGLKWPYVFLIFDVCF